MPETPRNQEGQKPTRDPDETEQRLREKEQAQRGEANRVRTEEQIEEVRREER